MVSKRYDYPQRVIVCNVPFQIGAPKRRLNGLNHPLDYSQGQRGVNRVTRGHSRSNA
jgi:hypothetical protein